MLVHLSAVMFEIALSLTIIEVYLNNRRKNERSILHSKTQTNLFYKIYHPIEKVLCTYLSRFQFKNKTYNELSSEEKIYLLKNNLNSQQIQEIVSVYQRHYWLFKNWCEIFFRNPRLPIHNPVIEMYSALQEFEQLRYYRVLDKDVADSIHTGENLDHDKYMPSTRELFFELITHWYDLVEEYIPEEHAQSQTIAGPSRSFVIAVK